MRAFYLGTHMVNWLAELPIPLFVSRRRLIKRKTQPRAREPWGLDSGGFTELSMRGAWTVSEAQYIDEVARWSEEIGKLDFAAPMDWMCEPHVLEATGKTVREHQELTVQNYLSIRSTGLPFIPVLQGWTVDEYLACVSLYREAGVDLSGIVGLGTVCRRQDTESGEDIVRELHSAGVERMHGFGIKITGLGRYGHLLDSADSMAWSFNARKNPPIAGHTHVHCNNCPEWAMRWRTRVGRSLHG